MKPSLKRKEKTYRLQLQLMAKKSQQTRDDCLIKTACVQRLQKQGSLPSFSGPTLCVLPSPHVGGFTNGGGMGGGGEISGRIGFVIPGQPALQICLHTNNISLAKVRWRVADKGKENRLCGGGGRRGICMPGNHNRNVPTAHCFAGGDDSATQALTQLITPLTPAPRWLAPYLCFLDALV